jgi:metallo-beta-lactamase family protein
MIKIAFDGAARDVTGSRHLITVNQHQLLLDCGLYQGRRKETYDRNLNFPFDPALLEALILSHAHIDHIGNIPNLVKKGFKGDIHCTMATADLVNIMLMDSAHIQENDALFVNKIRKKHNESEISPLYTRADVAPALDLIVSHGYNRSFIPVEGVRCTFREAGHILGSAITVMDVNDSGRQLSVCYTGDLGRPGLPIIRDPFVVVDSDVLIIESTYGNRLHSDIKIVDDKLADVINKTVARKGKIIVPSFALERTQEIVYALNRLRQSHKIPDFPIYVDSPLATDATDIFRLHPECFDSDLNEFIRTVDDPFGFRHLHYTRTTEESKMLNAVEGPIMIIAGSGMAENGRVLHHLKNNIGDPKNTVMIVGWQAANTLGRKITEKWPQVPIFGELHDLKCEVVVFDEFSSHADQKDLMNWILQGKDRWQKIFVVHGEEETSLAFAKDLMEAGFGDVIVPHLGESFTL